MPAEARIRSTTTWFNRFAGEAPPERLAVVRAGVFGFGAIYVAARSKSIIDLNDLSDDRFEPVGPIGLIGGPISLGMLWVLIIVAISACCAASLGWKWRVSGPIAAIGLMTILSYRLSWGQVLHTENLLVMHALVLAVTPAADAWALDRRANIRDRWIYGWALQTLALLTILGYVIAAIAKLRNGGVDWMTGDVLRNHVALDNLTKEVLGDISSPLANIFVPHGWLFQPMAVASMVIELGAIAAMIRGRLRVLWLAMTWFFHVAILALMAILFPYQLFGVAFLPFIEGEVVIRRSWQAFHRPREAQRR